MNSLLRPALYGAYHPIASLSAASGHPCLSCGGTVCETGDVLGHDRQLPETREGTILVIANAGAYGSVMSSAYNWRAPAGERVL